MDFGTSDSEQRNFLKKYTRSNPEAMVDTRKRIENPKTGRLVLMTGRVGQSITKSKKMKRSKHMEKMLKKKKNVPHSDILKARKLWIQSLKSGPTAWMKGGDHAHFLLCINTTQTAPQQGMLMNRFEEATSEITSMTHTEIQKYDRKKGEFSNLTQEQLSTVGYKGKSITFENVWLNNKNKKVGETKCTYTNTKGYFTVEEMVKNIVKFEQVDRPKSCWFGGVDCHHIFFEGIHKNKNGKTYCIHWGS